jgi:hypothetical protein
MIISIGTELTAIGFGLDITGAVFLGKAVIGTPIAHKTELEAFKQNGGDLLPSPIPLRNRAATTLEGRVGVTYLLLGFGLQLLGLLVPSAPFSLAHSLAALICAAIAMLLSAAWGRRYVSRNQRTMENAILTSMYVGVYENMEERERIVRKHGSTKFEDPLTIRLARLLYRRKPS